MTDKKSIEAQAYALAHWIRRRQSTVVKPTLEKPLEVHQLDTKNDETNHAFNRVLPEGLNA